ncbi:MAG: LPS assembly protein LptD, partial [Burkholderiaceae bacterium]|nr:LPS assembly protein LptD [Burkholderiaceae bacterium]
MPPFPVTTAVPCHAMRATALAVALLAVACALVPARAQSGSGAATVPSASQTDPADQADTGALANTPVTLRATPRLAEKVAPSGHGVPSFLSGNQISGRPDLETVVNGNAELRRPGLSVHADQMRYDQTTDVVTVLGNVHANDGGNRYRAPQGRVQTDAMEGVFLHPSYELLINGGHGQAERVDLLDPDRSVIINGNYTTCRPGDPVIPQQGDIQSASNPDWKPDWVLRAKRMSIDQDTGMGQAEDGVIVFKGVPILAAPSLTFPLSSERLSGWLTPTFGLDNQSGLTLALPYYWNIAPNRDATLTSTVMTRRGEEFDGEFRYLESNYKGTLEAVYMPYDLLRNRNRWGLFAHDDGNFDTGFSSIGHIGFGLNFNRVSDNNYWQDFPQQGLFNLSRLLDNDGSLSWAHPGKYGDWSVSLSAQSWQVLQEPTSIIVPPYARLPELNVRWGRTAATNGTGDWDYSVEGDYTRFQAPSALTSQPNANRTYLDAWLSHPWRQSWGFLTPKVELNAVNYQFSSALTGAGVNGSTANIVVPTASLDSGLIFERDARYFGRSFTQTLEPRLLYVYTPNRNQNNIPLYDTGPYDFNFASIWVDNTFVGHDRFSNENTVTGGVTSRLLDPNSGSELLQLAVAQRYRFSPQQVTVPGQTPSGRGWSDVMLGGGVSWDPRWSVDTVLQYNTNTHQSTNTTLNLHYAPGPLRLVNFAYSRDLNLNNEYYDIGFQWPLFERAQRQVDRTENPSDRKGGACKGGSWYGVGRLNYSIIDHQMIDGILGVEYDAGCWVGRVVLEKLETTTATVTKRLMFQLELSGLTRLGMDPISSLRENIPGYQPTGQPGTPPSRFS